MSSQSNEKVIVGVCVEKNYSKRRIEYLLEDSLTRIAKGMGVNFKVNRFTHNEDYPMCELKYDITVSDLSKVDLIIDTFNGSPDFKGTNIEMIYYSESDIVLSYMWDSSDWSNEVKREDEIISNYVAKYGIAVPGSKSSDALVIKGTWSNDYEGSFSI